MKKRPVVLHRTLLALPMLLAAAVPALRAAEDETPSAMLQAATVEILIIACPEGGPPTPDVVAAQVRPILDRTMDFEAITRRALGSGWRSFAAAERTRAVELFTALMVRTCAVRFSGGERPKIDYKPPVAIAPDRWEVPTQVSRDGSSYEIIYRIERRPGGLRICDIVAEGVSFVANYRAQFDALFQKGGTAAVLHALEARQAAIAGH